MKRLYLLLFLIAFTAINISAQRKTDKLDRGLVAVLTPGKGVFTSWRIQADEYYGVKYNLYRDGSLIAENIEVSNYQDAGGTATSTYKVIAVGENVNDAKSISVWSNGRVAKGSNQPAEQPNHLSIPMQDVVDRNGNVVFCCCGSHTPTEEFAQTYTLNDASFADLDGDGEMEIIIKRINEYDASDVYKSVYDVRYPFSNEGFNKWSRVDSKGVSQGAASCAWNLNTSTSLVYGGTDNNNYANLPEFNKMYITTSDGEPLMLFNQGSAVPVESVHESVVENSNGTKTYIFNVREIVTKKGYAHLNAIKGANNQNITVTNIEYTKPKPVYDIANTTAFVIIEAYKLNGTRLWWIDCGPNMVSLNSTEINAVAYDWDEDGRAEVLLRGADNMIVHKSDGSSYTIGDPNINTRSDFNHGTSQYAWTHTGAEYLIYLEGATATKYQVVPFPLPRFESDETGLIEQQVWSPLDQNGGYGHRSSKYFFGAPVLDGRKASIFLARGIYTQTKMVALDVNKSTHELAIRWTWRCKDVNSDWFGQGNHNFSIADVDGDGCDEIIYGSMVIDNNGKGLSTTGFGHGDALHVGDLDPFRKGMEVFACNEDEPSNNFRNATTSEIYLREPVHYDSKGNAIDDGRAMAGNFSNDYPGCLAASTQSGVAALSKVQANPLSPVYMTELTNSCFQKPWTPMSLNGRIYWDGDLLEEAFDSPGTESEGVVSKNGTRIFQSSGCKLNNDSKNNPCAQGDIIGDWREEILLRAYDNKSLHLYTTTYPTEHRIPSLWYDPEYRQAMVWQVCGYNQPPHVSYFMGEMEGLTKVPVPLTMEGRTEVTAGNSITSANNGKDVMLYGAGNFGLNGNNSPANLFVNVPSTVSGNNDNNAIDYDYSQAQLGYDSNKGDLTGTMNLVKQGDGLLKLTAREFTYTGNTDVFAGSLYFRGTLNSPVWMNRHTTLYAGGTFKRPVVMEYGSTLYISQDNSKADGSAPDVEYATTSMTSLELHEGSRVVFDIDVTGNHSDVLNLTDLSVRKRDWKYGPEYLAPVFKFNINGKLQPGKYPIGKLSEVDGSLDDIILEGNFGYSNEVSLVVIDGFLYLDVENNGNTYIGNDDYSTPFWGDFSESYTIQSGYNCNFKFTNYGNVSEAWYNWILVAANGSGHSSSDRSDYAEYFVLRADNHGWQYCYDESNLSNNYDWNTFKTDMTEADVDMNVRFVDGIVYMDASIICKNGKSYAYSFHSKAFSADEVTMFFTVDHSYMTEPEVKMKEIDPTNLIIANTLTYDFTQGSTGNDVVYLTYDKDYATVGQSGWTYSSVYAKEVDGNVVFARLANASKQYGFCYRYGGLLCINQSHTLSLVGLKEGTIVTVTTSSNAISEAYKGNKGGTWNSSVNSDANTYKYVMTSQGDLNLLMSVGSYVYTITIVEPENLVLEPKYDDSYEPGVYGSVKVNRIFKAGYSSLCVPFATTVDKFTQGDNDAYVAYLSETKEENGSYTLIFTNTKEIEANKPYILYVSQELSTPVLINQPVFSESPKTITYGDWSMSGNYEVNKSMHGLYGVANNIDIQRGGANSKLNGLTAYLTGPSNGAKIRIVDSNGATIVENVKLEDEATVTAIYTINGTKVTSLQPGINILKMSDGSVRKVMRK